MAATCSFDVTSTVDLQEVDNALNQARKEVVQRYDFKGSKADIQFNRTENTITLAADDEFKMKALWEIVQGRMVNRGVPVKNLTLGDVERGARTRSGASSRCSRASPPTQPRTSSSSSRTASSRRCRPRSRRTSCASRRRRATSCRR